MTRDDAWTIVHAVECLIRAKAHSARGGYVGSDADAMRPARELLAQALMAVDSHGVCDP